MSLTLAGLVEWWRQRLAALLRDPAPISRPWLVAMRVRILRFLVSRYAEADREIGPTSIPARPPRVPWVHPSLRGPLSESPSKPPARLAAILDEIHRLNRRERPHWLVWFRRRRGDL